MRIAIIGGTGFVGSYLVDALLAAGHTPRLLVRPGSREKLFAADRCEVVEGSVAELCDLRNTIEGSDAVIFNIGILREDRSAGITFEELQHQAVLRTIEATRACGVTRILLMSANGVRDDGTPYQRTKRAAEIAVSDSALDYTIFRPSVIFGDPRGLMEIGTQLLQDVVRLPIPAPGFISGFSPTRSSVVMSPVHVLDVADAMVASLADASTIGRTLVLGGPDVLSWSDMIRRVAAAVGRSKWVLPAPVPLVRIPVRLLDWIPGFPVTDDQLKMLVDGNAAEPAVLESLIGRKPAAFDRDGLAYLATPVS